MKILLSSGELHEVHVEQALAGAHITQYHLDIHDIEELLRIEERGCIREWLLHKLTRMPPIK